MKEWSLIGSFWLASSIKTKVFNYGVIGYVFSLQANPIKLTFLHSLNSSLNNKLTFFYFINLWRNWRRLFCGLLRKKIHNPQPGKQSQRSLKGQQTLNKNNPFNSGTAQEEQSSRLRQVELWNQSFTTTYWRTIGKPFTNSFKLFFILERADEWMLINECCPCAPLAWAAGC